MQGGLVNLTISFAAIGAGYLLDWLDYPIDFATCFFITSIAMAGSYIAIAQTREPEDLEKAPSEEKHHFLDDARVILSRDRNFNWYLVARTLSQFATMAFGFYILYGLRRFDMSDITAGYLTAALTVTATFANAAMGWLGDKWGHRSMLILGAVAATGSTALAWLAPSLDWMYPVFILSGVANVAIWTIGITFTVGFGTEAERPTYIGLSNTLITPATILAPIIGGWMVDHVSFETTFGASTIIGIVTACILIFIVKDPGKAMAVSAD
jgi:MFS family permease